MPNVGLEAMAAGLPVVATRVEGTEELIRDGKTGWLCPPADPSGLAAAIEKVLVDAKRARSMGASGQARVRAEFSWEQMVWRYDDLYRSTLDL